MTRHARPVRPHHLLALAILVPTGSALAGAASLVAPPAAARVRPMPAAAEVAPVAGRPTPPFADTPQATPVAEAEKPRPSAPVVEDRDPAPRAGEQAILPNGLPSWIVMLSMRPSPDDAARVAEAERAVDALLDETIGRARPHQRYTSALVGFAAGMTPDEAARLAADPRVLVVQPDRVMGLDRVMGDDRGGDLPIGENPNLPAPWNLRRISARDGLAPAFDPCGATGEGVTAVVIDSGIVPSHTEFGGRVIATRNFAITGSPDAADNEGHGTHVAGTVAGATVGVAPGADIVALSVTEESGVIFESSWVAALNWVVAAGNVTRPAVVNMSLGGLVLGPSPVQDLALVIVESLGIPVVVAAGNDSYMADWKTPAALRFAITVGSTDLADRPSSFSNHGPIVDIWAPGSAIVSADWKRPDGGLSTNSGTSMATPAVTGAVALFLAERVSFEDLELRSATIPGRAAIWLARHAARGVLHDNLDARVASPGGNGALGGAANLLLQACGGPVGAPCDEPVEWHGQSASIVLGDGITPLDAGFACERLVRHPAGPVSLTVNRTSIGRSPSLELLARVTIEDAATGESVWTSDRLYDFETWTGIVEGNRRTFRSSSPAGFRVRWESLVDSGIAGYGFVMTAQAAGACPGDLDGDGDVGAIDLALLFDAWGPCAASDPCVADLDLDGAVNSADAAILLASWGACGDFVPDPWVRNCTGGLLHRSFIGDVLPDIDLRTIVRDPLVDPTASTSMNATCAEAFLDVAAGNPVSVGFDAEIGGCVLPDGGCGTGTSLACSNAHGYFIGRGTDCDSLDPTLDASLLACAIAPVTTGCPVPWEGWLQSEVYGALRGADFTHTQARWRQELPGGVSSISVLGFPAEIASQALSSANGTGFTTAVGYPVAVEAIEFDVLVEYRDGGAPDLFRRTARARPLASPLEPGLFRSTFLFTLSNVVADAGREIRSIEVSCFRDAPLAASSLVNLTLSGRLAEPGETPAEFSPDGGRSWITGEPAVQLAFWIVP